MATNSVRTLSVRTGDQQSVTVRAPAKINVFFRVGAQNDDGAHDIASLYQAVSLYNEVTARPAARFSLTFAGDVDVSELPAEKQNLALRAAKLLAKATGFRGGVSLRVLKRIPVAGGLGGASADAAATLVACDELWGTGLGRAGLLPLAAKLGADVPFALEGGTAVGTGRGDELSPALAKGVFHWVLAFSGSGLYSAEVYRALEQHRADHRADLAPAPAQVSVDTAVLQAVRLGDAESLAEAMHNDLQAAALRLAPNLSELLELGECQGALAGIVSGSGPTIAFLVPDALAAAELNATLTKVGAKSLPVTGPVSGARQIDAA